MNCKRVDLASQDVFLLLVFFMQVGGMPDKIRLFWLDLLFLFRIIDYCYGCEF